ncbi:MAG: hypothetical protein LBU53_07420 [Zoogloeaceae bacterium]|jgi:hypothetical protein|nr:hypothetical protein [Zoogloeaceae bacterium]
MMSQAYYDYIAKFGTDPMVSSMCYKSDAAQDEIMRRAIASGQPIDDEALQKETWAEIGFPGDGTIFI